MASKSNPAVSGKVLTPSDSDTFPPTRGLYVGTTGNITVDLEKGDADSTNILFTAVPVGILPIAVTRVYSTGTTASTIIALR